MSKVPEYTLAGGKAESELHFRSLKIERFHTDLRQARVVVTVNGEVKWDETRASKHVNAAAKMLRGLVTLKNEREKLLKLKAKAGSTGESQDTLNERLALLDDRFAIILKAAPLDGVPADWLAAVTPKARK